MSARDAVLGAVRRAVGAGGDDATRRAAVEARLKTTPRGLIPERGQKPPEDRIVLFAEMAEKAAATTARIATPDDVPTAVAEYLRAHNLPASVKTGSDQRLSALPWSGTQIDVSHGPAVDSDRVAVSHADTGVAEAGTLLLTSGTDNPTTLNFLPDVHIVVLRTADIVGDFETAWDELREKFGRGVMPRTVNMIAGPSRSGDIEQTLLLGAHGPRSLHVLIVG